MKLHFPLSTTRFFLTQLRMDSHFYIHENLTYFNPNVIEKYKNIVRFFKYDASLIVVTCYLIIMFPSISWPKENTVKVEVLKMLHFILKIKSVVRLILWNQNRNIFSFLCIYELKWFRECVKLRNSALCKLIKWKLPKQWLSKIS